MAYLEEMLMRQAAAAQERQAAQALLQRLQAMEWAAGAKQTGAVPITEPSVGTSAGTEEKTAAARERTAMSDVQRQREALETAEIPDTEVVQHSLTPVQRLLQQLTALAGTTTVPASAGMTGDELPLAEDINWMHMAQRLDRAVAATMPAAAERSGRLASDGPRSMENYGQADAAALSRLYERDARRYDSRFELPL